MRTGIHIRPRIGVEYPSILLWDNTVDWTPSPARGAASCALRQPAANSPKSQFLLSHSGVEQQCGLTRRGHQTVLAVGLRSSVLTREAR
jgi:hypothetical protein